MWSVRLGRLLYLSSLAGPGIISASDLHIERDGEREGESKRERDRESERERERETERERERK